MSFQLKKIQINGKIFHAHGLEELMLLKCPHYLKQSIYSMQCVSKFNGIFFSEIEWTIQKLYGTRKDTE